MNKLSRQALLVQAGISDKKQSETFWTETIGMIRPGVMAAVKRGEIRYSEVDDIVMLAAEKAVSGIGKWDVSKGDWSTWMGTVVKNCLRDEQRRALKETAMIQQVSGQGIDPDTIVPCAAIAQDPDALYEWDEQIGKWMCDNMQIDAGMLAKLRTGLIKKYGLKNEHQ